MNIVLEHVRSFCERQSIPLRPLTLLVGENSSGKSTFLSVVSCIFDEARFPSTPAFNEPPYNLGTFDTIATYKGGRYGRADSFSIGFSVKEQDGGHRETTATYCGDYGNIVLSKLRSSSHSGTIAVDISSTDISVTLAPLDGDSLAPRHYNFKQPLNEPAWLAQRPLLYQVMEAVEFEAMVGQPEMISVLREMTALLRTMQPPYGSSFSFAPIRSKPRRTYDEFSEDYSPEGDHVPTMLARLLREEQATSESRRIQEALVRFGEESGLFRKVTAKRLGSKPGDPFQIQVTISGPAVNLTDVGYGVSQALPVVVQSVMKTKSKAFLMQQPEVHLHPRAQAALGSFFADLAAHGRHTFLIETHSDFLVDRVRQEVAKGTIAHKHVQILFFHKPHLDTTVWPITVDRDGNVENAPPEYRDFFLNEEISLLSRASD